MSFRKPLLLLTLLLVVASCHRKPQEPPVEPEAEVVPPL